MESDATNDPFAAVHAAATSSPNFDIDNATIVNRLKLWQSLCSFVSRLKAIDQIDFTTLPKDMDLRPRPLRVLS